MRTIEAIDVEIAGFAETDEYASSEDRNYDAGMKAGFRKGQLLLERGLTSEEILEQATLNSKAYKSHGDDDGDAWQSGYTCALLWCAEQFDWDAAGIAVDRQPPGAGEY